MDGRIGGKKGGEADGRRNEKCERVDNKKKIRKSTLTYRTQNILNKYHYHVITFNEKEGRHETNNMSSIWKGFRGHDVLAQKNRVDKPLSVKMILNDDHRWTMIKRQASPMEIVDDYVGNNSSEHVYADEASSDSVSEQEDKRAGLYFSSSDN